MLHDLFKPHETWMIFSLPDILFSLVLCDNFLLCNLHLSRINMVRPLDSSLLAPQSTFIFIPLLSSDNFLSLSLFSLLIYFVFLLSLNSNKRSCLLIRTVYVIIVHCCFGFLFYILGPWSYPSFSCQLIEFFKLVIHNSILWYFIAMRFIWRGGKYIIYHMVRLESIPCSLSKSCMYLMEMLPLDKYLLEAKRKDLSITNYCRCIIIQKNKLYKTLRFLCYCLQ